MAAFARSSRPVGIASPEVRTAHPPKIQETAAPRQLPNGPCSFRDLSWGRNARTCGCQRFWLDNGSGKEEVESRRDSRDIPKPWCFCGHHACFHEFASIASNLRNGGEITLGESRQLHDEDEGSDDEYPNDAMPPHGNTTPDFIKGQQLEEWPSDFVTESSGHLSTRLQALKPGLGISMVSNVIQNRVNTPLPATHAQVPSTTTRPLPSTQSPMRRPSDGAISDGRLRQTPSRTWREHAGNAFRPIPSVDVTMLPSGLAPYDPAQSATEVATPSMAGTPALRGLENAIDAVKSGIAGLGDALDGTNINLTSDIPRVGLPHLSRDPRRTSISCTPFPSRYQLNLNDPARVHDTETSYNIGDLVSQISSLKEFLCSNPHFGTSLFSLNHRLDALETMSFSHASVDGLEQRIELFDGRLLDVEHKVEELERLHAAHEEYLESRNRHASGRRAGTRKLKGDATSFRSGDSFDSNMSIHSTSAADHAERVERLQSLERRLIDLEATALPSVSQPWDVEVILVPWGSQLKGIWSACEDFSGEFRDSATSVGGRSSSLGLQASDLTSGKQRSGSRAGAQSQAFDEWVSNSPDAWLSAQACSPSTAGSRRIVYERLRSRGLVRRVAITGNSARDVHSAIAAAFGDTLELMAKQDYRPSTHHSNASQPLGLQAPYIPLRKIRKSSRLRFLSPAELATPSIWTADFLDSTIFMKAPTVGRRTLFITHAAAYLQHGSRTTAWTWQKLRELPRYRLDVDQIKASPALSFVDEGDAKEPCWAFNVRLDPPVNVHSSFASHHSASFHGSLGSHPLSPQHTGSPSSASESEPEAEVNNAQIRPSLPTERPCPITPMSDRPPSRRPFRRTISLPLTDPGKDTTSEMPKRHIASFGQVTSSPPKNSQTKRQRLSQIPDTVERTTQCRDDGSDAAPRTPHDETATWNLTPRRSREPPSPPRCETRVPQEVPVKKHATPSAYATPYSNAVFPPYRQRPRDADTDMESLSGSERNARAPEEEAWEGVDEDGDGNDDVGSVDLSEAEIDDDFSPGEEDEGAEDVDVVMRGVEVDDGDD